MKLEAINTKTVEEITKELKEQGISSSRLEGAQSSTFMCESGKFTDIEIMNPITPEQKTKIDAGENVQLFTHVALNFESDDKLTKGKISLSRLQLQAITKENFNPDELPTGTYTRNNEEFVYLKGEPINPSLQGNQASVIKMLVGKKFNATKVDCFRAKYNPEGYTSVSEIETEPVVTYKIELAR